MNITAISDLHGMLPRVEPCDLLVIAGDICPDALPEAQAAWLDSTLRRWLETIPAAHVVATWGNHDFIGERPELLPALPWTLLADSGAVVCGLSIYASPYSGLVGPWAFMEPEWDLRERWRRIPPGLDLLIVHGPPYGACDRVTSGRLAGSESLRDAIETTRPRFVVCGHIHEARGRTVIGDTHVLNVSLVNNCYDLVHAPVSWIWVATDDSRRDHVAR